MVNLKWFYQSLCSPNYVSVLELVYLVMPSSKKMDPFICDKLSIIKKSVNVLTVKYFHT